MNRSFMMVLACLLLGGPLVGSAQAQGTVHTCSIAGLEDYALAWEGDLTKIELVAHPKHYERIRAPMDSSKKGVGIDKGAVTKKGTAQESRARLKEYITAWTTDAGIRVDDMTITSAAQKGNKCHVDWEADLTNLANAKTSTLVGSSTLRLKNRYIAEEKVISSNDEDVMNALQ